MVEPLSKMRVTGVGIHSTKGDHASGSSPGRYDITREGVVSVELERATVRVPHVACSRDGPVDRESLASIYPENPVSSS
jgi:hypothetical protein